jgi:AcrR family transcriptional regulator
LGRAAGGYGRPAMVRTPWGNAEKLRERMLSPGAGVPREEVARSQRERLLGAMVAVCAERGYEAATVADLVALSGVSRSGFYMHFANKKECFGAAVGEILERTEASVAARYKEPGSPLGAFIEQVVAQPAAARACFVESFAAGPEAVAKMDRAVVRYEALMAWAIERRARWEKMPAVLVEAIVGGLRKVIYTRLLRGTEAELIGMVEEMRQWSFGYRPPPQPLRRRRGTVAESALFRLGDPAERLMAAASETIAERGYPAVTVVEVAERAGTSPSTFYEHFDGKEDVVAAALEAGQAQMLAVAGPASRRAKGWPGAVRAGFEATTDFLAAHPAFARLGIVEVFAGTTLALERRDETIESFQGFMAPGYELAPEVPPIAAEAIGGAAYELLYRQVRSGGTRSLPEAAPLMTYLALAPFLGPEEACAVARGR